MLFEKFEYCGMASVVLEIKSKLNSQNQKPELSKLPIRSEAGSLSLISCCKHSPDEIRSF